MTSKSESATALNVSYDSQLMQDYLQSAGILVNQNQTSISAFQNSEGETEAVVIGDDGQLYHVYREPLSDSGWSSYGLGAGFQTIGAVDGITFCGVGNDGNLWENNAGRWGMIPANLPSGRTAASISAGSDGTIWAVDQYPCLYVKGAAVAQSGVQTPPTFSSSVAPAVYCDSAGLLHFFCIDASGALWTIQQVTSGGAWGRWSPLSALPSKAELTAISVSENQNGALQIFALDSGGSLHSLYQTTVNGPWSSWVPLSSDNKSLREMVVKLGSDGLLHVFAIGTDNNLWHIDQTAPNNGWSSWSSLGSPQAGASLSSLSVEENQDGRLEAFLLLSNAYPYHIYQTAPGGPWSGWDGFPLVPVQQMPAILSDLTVARNSDGHLELFVLAESRGLQDVMHIWQQSPNGSWINGWASLQYQQFTEASLKIGTNQSGALEAFVISNGSFWHCYQTTPGGSWSGWASLGAPDSALQTMTVVCDASGKLELFATTANQTAVLIVQSQTGSGGWTTWVSSWWTWYPIGAAPSLAAAPTGSANAYWAVATDGKVYSCNGKSWSALSLPDSDQAKFASAEQDGSLWVLSAKGTLYHYSNGSFQAMPGSLAGVNSFSASSATNIWATASADGNRYRLYRYSRLEWKAVEAPPMQWWNSYPSVSVASNGAVWILDGTVGCVWRCTLAPANWSWIPMALATGANGIAAISAASTGAAWAVDKSGGVWRFGRSWKQASQTLPAKAAVREISAGLGGTLWCIDTAGTPYQKTKTGWQAVAGLSGPLKHAPSRWAVTEAGDVFQYSNANWSAFSPKPPAAQAVSGADDGSAWLLDTNGALWQLGSKGFERLSGAPGAIQQIAVMDSEHGWVISEQSGKAALYLYQKGLWQQVEQGAPALEGSESVLLSAASDGTVWLVDANGIPLRLNWTPEAETLSTQAANLSFQSIAAWNTSTENAASSQLGAAWAVSSDGIVWRTQGKAWINAEIPLPSAAIPTQISATADGSVWALDRGGKLYRKETWTSPAPAPTAAFELSPTAMRDQSGCLQACCIDASGALWVIAETASNSGYGDWTQLKAPLKNALGVLMSKKPNGALRIFAFGIVSASSVNGVCVADQDASAPGGWSPFVSLDPPGLPAGEMITYGIGQTAAGGSFVLAVVQSGPEAQTSIVQTWQASSGGDWSNWTELPSLPGNATVTGVVTANDPDGAIYCFATTGGAPFVISNRKNSSTGWTSWQSMGLPGGVSEIPWLVAGNDWGNGGAEVFTIANDSDGNAAVYHSWQDANQSSGWSGWAPLGAPDGAAIDDLAAGNDASTKELFVIAHSRDGALHQIWPQQSSATGWGTWQPVTSQGASGAAFDAFTLASDVSGSAPALFAVSSGTLWCSAREQQATTGWRNWNPLNGPQYWKPVSTAPVLAQAPCGDGKQLWALNTEGVVYRSSDSGNQWYAMAFPSSGSAVAVASISSGTDGTIWAVSKPSGSSVSSCYRFETNGWTEVATGEFTQAPVGTLNELWVIDASGSENVLRSNDGGASWWTDKNISAKTQEIAAAADGSVWLIDAKGNPSLCPAWQRIMQPVQMPGSHVPAGCKEVAAGQNQFGDRYVFFIDNSGQLSFSCEVMHHAWVDLGVIAKGTGLSRLGLTRQQDTNELIAYALNSGMMLIARQPDQRYSAFTAISCPAVFGNVLELSDLEVIAIDANHWYFFGIADGNLFGAQLDPAQLSGANVPLSMVGNVSNLARLVRLPWKRQNSNPSLAAVDTSGTLQVIDITTQDGTSFFANVTALTGQGALWPSGATSVSAMLQSSDIGPSQMRFYATAPASGTSGALWVIRKIDASLPMSRADGWSSWIPLGGDQVALASGPCFASADTLFTFDAASLSLTAVSQNETTGKWTVGEVKRPSRSGNEIETVPMYYTDVTVTNSQGVPQPQVAVNITSETPVLAIIEGVAFEVDTVRGVTCNTNHVGKLIIRTMAEGLHAPAFTLTVLTSDENTRALNNSGPATTIQPSGHVYNFMAGTEMLPVGGGKPASFTVETLQAFKPGITNDTATSVVTNVASICKLPGSGSGEGAPAGFALDRSHPDMPRLRVFSTKEELAAYQEQHRHRLASGLVGGFFSGVWHDIKHAGEDVVDGIKKGVTSVEHFVVDTANKTVSFTLKVAGEIVTTFDMVINTIKDAVLAIEAIVATLVADIEAIIKWLMLLFDWENIIATQKALTGYINELVTLANSEIGSLQKTVHELFSKWSDQFEEFLGKIIGNFAGPVSSLPTNWSTGSPAAGIPSPRGRLGATASLPNGGSSGHANWMLHKVLNYLTPSLSFASAGTLDASTFLDAFDGQNILTQFADAFTAFWQGLIDIFKDPAKFVDLSIATFLTVAEHLVQAFIDFIEDLIDGVLALMQSIMNGIDGMFNRSLHIPFISSLYRLITGEDLTIIGLGTLVIAVPFYILHRLVFDANPFSESARIEARAVAAGSESLSLAAHDAQTTEVATSEGAGTSLGNSTQRWQDAYFTLGIVNWLIGFIHDTATCAKQDSAQPTINMMSLFSDIAQTGLLICSWPDPKGFPFVTLSNDAAYETAWLYWGASATVPAYDLGVMAFKNSDPAIQELGDYEPVFDTSMGLGALVFATLAGALGYTASPRSVNIEGLTEYLISPWGTILQFTLVPELRSVIEESTLIDPAWVILGLDLILNIAVPSLNLAA
jgi:hypothetical protein